MLDNILELLAAAAAGGFVVLLAFPALIQYRKEAKTRLLRGMVKDAGALASLDDDSDPVAAAQRAAAEKELLAQLQAAVAKLSPPAG